jgi:putative spermidine/putrescine transport system permease protein
VGNRLETQATVLGAGPVMTFRRITLPLIMPGMLAAFTLSFTISIAQYITTLMIGGGRIITLTVLFVPFIGGGQTHIAAVYSVLLIIVAVISLVLMEYVVKRYYNFENVFYT